MPGSRTPSASTGRVSTCSAGASAGPARSAPEDVRGPDAAPAVRPPEGAGRRPAGVALCGVSKAFGALAAVDDVSIEVAPGEFVVLLGPSGCGKTTTLRMIAGFTRPSRGAVLIDGVDVTRQPPRRRNIGMVFQNYALFPNMSVAENVAFGLRQRRQPRAMIRTRVTELLALVRLTDKQDSSIHGLSGGQQQRVALARALACSPRVLLMDEAMTLADRIVVMNQGRVQQAAAPELIYGRPANRFVAGFVGKNNFLGGRVARIADGMIEVELVGTRVRVRAAGAALRPGDAVEL